MVSSISPPTRRSATAIAFREKRQQHWDQIARAAGDDGWARTYHRRLQRVYQTLILPGQRVLELGCGSGDLLAMVQPARGVGVDLSGEMVAVAAARHPHLVFIHGDAHDVALDERFDVIVCSDLISDVWDVEQVLANARRMLATGGRIMLNSYSRLWEVPLRISSGLGRSRPMLDQNWLTAHDVRNLFDLADCEVVREWQEFLCPVAVPGVEPLCNRVLVKSWPFAGLALANFFVARARPLAAESQPERTVSIVVPARNEAGHIDSLFARLPEFGARLELIFVEGHSTDDTYAVIEKAIASHPERTCQLMRQGGKGKGDAVRLGFSKASGDILMILDADLTVAPEDLPRFYQALVTGKGDFVNGVRLVYPREDGAMRFFNLLANKFFGWLFSWLIGQKIKDTLCGTKVLWHRDYDQIVSARGYFGDFDPFGDFELLFGAARLSRKIAEMPVRYAERFYGETNIRRWRDGWLLFRMAAVAARRLKWV